MRANRSVSAFKKMADWVKSNAVTSSIIGLSFGLIVFLLVTSGSGGDDALISSSPGRSTLVSGADNRAQTNGIPMASHGSGPSRIITGTQMMERDPSDWAAEYGFRIFHQTWKNHDVPARSKVNFDSWDKFHDNGLHVLWGDDENLVFLERYYPEFVELYHNLVLNIQRTDLVRVLYLHRYGGVYVDLDYEAHADIFEHLPTTDAGETPEVMVVGSPVLLNEVMQNSFMIATQYNHPYWYEVGKSINEIVSFINDPSQCLEWGGCALLEFFHNRFTKKVVNLVFTLYITGPAVLDKTWLRHVKKGWTLETLPPAEFFLGTVAQHHQDNTWVDIPSTIPEVIAALTGMVLMIVLLSILVCMQRCRLQRYKRMITGKKSVEVRDLEGMPLRKGSDCGLEEDDFTITPIRSSTSTRR